MPICALILGALEWAYLYCCTEHPNGMELLLLCAVCVLHNKPFFFYFYTRPHLTHPVSVPILTDTSSYLLCGRKTTTERYYRL